MATRSSNKLERDGFWHTMWLCVFPYRCQDNLANDAILKSQRVMKEAEPYLHLFPG